MSSILCWNDGVVKCFGCWKWVLQHIKIIALQSFCCQVCGRERALWFPRGALGEAKGREDRQTALGWNGRKSQKRKKSVTNASYFVVDWSMNTQPVTRVETRCIIIALSSTEKELRTETVFPELRQDFLNWERYNTFAVCSVFVRSEAVYQWMAMLLFWH